MTRLYFFAATIFKEVFEKEGDEAKELDEKAQKYGYITIVSLESLENATVLAALTFIDISGALIGAFISISTYVALAINSKRFITRVTQETKSNCSNSAHHSNNTFDNLLCCYTYS